jgi:hypothetical protein
LLSRSNATPDGDAASFPSSSFTTAALDPSKTLTKKKPDGEMQAGPATETADDADTGVDIHDQNEVKTDEKKKGKKKRGGR